MEFWCFVVFVGIFFFPSLSPLAPNSSKGDVVPSLQMFVIQFQTENRAGVEEGGTGRDETPRV